jgi:hypothetical protein
MDLAESLEDLSIKLRSDLITSRARYSPENTRFVVVLKKRLGSLSIRLQTLGECFLI